MFFSSLFTYLHDYLQEQNRIFNKREKTFKPALKELD